jgi:3-dehydroquinate synthetase
VVSDCDADKVYQTIRKDKKKAGSGLHFVFLRGLGDAFTEEIDLDELNSILHDLC